jgi:hypothetical protein
VFLPFQSCFVVCATSAAPTFSPFLSVGSAKVRIFSEIPNKINFIFLPFFSSFPLFQYASLKLAFRPSEPGCKGSNLFFSRNIYFKINPALSITVPSFHSKPFLRSGMQK